MIYVKNKKQEDGYLLLDSLLTLGILMVIILLMYPLLINWLVAHREAGNLVEESRQMYEDSMQIKEKSFDRMESGEQFRLEETGVIIYEYTFE